MKKTRNAVTVSPITPGTTYHQKGFNFVVRYPSSQPGNPKERRFFRTKTEATNVALKLETDLVNMGREAASLSSDTMQDFTWALKKLEPTGYSIRDAVAVLLEKLEREERSVQVSEAVEEYIETLNTRGLSKRHQETAAQRMRRFAGDFGETLVASISTTDLQGWLAGLRVSALTTINYRTALSGFFRWSTRRGYAKSNPAATVELRKGKKQPPGILTPAEWRRVLHEAPNELLPVIALSGFCGLRPSEAERLDWQAVNLPKRLVTVDAEKNGVRRRFVPIPEAAVEWLQPVGKAKGPVYPFGSYTPQKKFHERLKREHGIEWPHDALRHSFASYAVAKEEDAGKVSLWMGHTESRTLHEHYRERVQPEEADAWFNTRPGGGEVIPIKEAGKKRA